MLMVRIVQKPDLGTPNHFSPVRSEFPDAAAFRAGGSPGWTWSDPTYLAVPGQDAFTRAARRAIPPTEYHAPEYRDDPVWLPAPSEFRSPRISAPPGPALFTPPLRLAGERVAAPFLPGKSWVEIRSGQRRLAQPVTLSSWATTEVLRPTVVEVAVNPDGDVLSARLIESNGMAAADEEAMRVARAARFQPIETESDWLSPSDVITGWEQLTFHWQTSGSSLK